MTRADSMAELRQDVATVQLDMASMSDKLDASIAAQRETANAQREQTAATKELVEAWKAARTLVTFVKWASGLVTALTVLWVVLKHFAWPIPS